MASFEKKMKRKRQVASRKAAKKQLKNAVKSTMEMEKRCGKCGKDFKEVSAEESLEWMVRYNGVSAELQCPTCYSMQVQDESIITESV